MARGVICAPVIYVYVTMYQFLPCHSKKILLLLVNRKTRGFKGTKGDVEGSEVGIRGSSGTSRDFKGSSDDK